MEVTESGISTFFSDVHPRNALDNLVIPSGIINSSREAAVAVQIELEKRDMLAGENTHENIFYASDLSENFVNMIQTILGKEKEELNIQFKNLDI